VVISLAPPVWASSAQPVDELLGVLVDLASEGHARVGAAGAHHIAAHALSP
jgi:hypothetical protein